MHATTPGRGDTGAAFAIADAGLIPGRTCPLSYGYTPAAFRRRPDLSADTLIVVGGLYGNVFAAQAVESLAARERGEVRVVFNGDWHWFDINPDDFAHIHATVARHAAIRGNVETELAADLDDAGCGCGYPDWVADADVDRSNVILQRLRTTAARWNDVQRRALSALPMHQVAAVGDLRVGIVHGDCWSLAGWGFAQETLAGQSAAVSEGLRSAEVDVFASSHTCLPVAQAFPVGARTGYLINNGAAGMPNFTGTAYGLATRISVRPSPDALYAACNRGVWIEAVPIRYNADAWRAHFVRRWPEGTPASVSYLRRISNGPDYRLQQAARSGFDIF